MELPLHAWAILVPYSVFVSGLGVLVGIGGGAFVIPLLVLAYGVPLKVAVAAITFSLMPSAFLTTAFNVRRGHIDYYAGVALEIPTIVGVVLGAYLTTVLPVRPLEVLFSCFLVFMGTRMLRKHDAERITWASRLNKLPPVIHKESGGHRYSMGVPAIGLLGTAAGVLAGLFGIGGGIIKTPVMNRIFHMPIRRSSATAIFMMTFTTATATYSHWKMGSMEWAIALPLGACFFSGSLLANTFGEKVKSTALETLLGFTLMGVATAILIHVWKMS